MTTFLPAPSRTHPLPEPADYSELRERGEWIRYALCRGQDPDALFVTGAEQRKAALICEGCPVIIQCGADALDNKVEFGVWGGMTERQRRALLRRHPEVTDWSEYLSKYGCEE